MLRRVVWGDCIAIIIIIIRVYDGRSRTLCNVGRLVPDHTLFFFIETAMIVSRKWNFNKVAYTNYD